MYIKELPMSDRPQEKLMYGGPESLSTSELLALVIRTGTREKSALQLAEEVLCYANDASGGLPTVDVAELQSICGIGRAKACSIIAGMELSRRLDNDRRALKQIKGSRDVFEYIEPTLRDQKKEYVVELILNSKCQVEAREVISIGDLSSATVHPREIFNPAIRKSAAAIIIIHNHPSGDPSPSRDDIEATRRLQEVSKIVGIRLMDHIIVGRDCFVSLREEGVIRE